MLRPLLKICCRGDDQLQQVLRVRGKIVDVHPFLDRVFPIALVEHNQFFIFDMDASGTRYTFVKRAPTPMPMPKGVRAAFPLDCYEGKVACVISDEVFESLEGYIAIFHEFIHCHQWEICEPKLRQKIEIAQKAMAKKDYMWEINYPFPYGDSPFAETYASFLKSLQESHCDDIFKYRNKLKQLLTDDDIEYMAWQEWKEGFARFIENKIRRRLGIEENHYGIEAPFHRVSFYEGGSAFIEFLTRQEPELLVDVEALFCRIWRFP